MLSLLKRHPESECGHALRVQIDATRPQPRVLSLRFLVGGPIDRVTLPQAGPPERTDGLWRSTCFEAFLVTDDGGYYEFNLSPSRRWAAYRFRGYRDGMTAADVAAPPIASRAAGAQFELRAPLHLDGLEGVADAAPLRLAVSAVLEEAGGVRSYWALAHPPGKPDFHHPDSFVLELPPTEPQ